MGLLGSLGIVSKAVLLLLFLFSVISWAVIFMKWRAFRVADLEDHRFVGLFAKTRDLEELHRQARRIAGGPSAKVFQGVMDRLDTIQADGEPSLSGGKEGAGFTPADRHVVERTAAHVAQSQLAQLEAYLPFLATTGNITPFIGLLGTVMGIIDAFREIGTQGTASIAAVAPGVAEALIATAAGLFTAIPAVIAYNYFLSRIRRTAFRLDTVTVEMLSLLRPKAKPAPVGVE